MYLSESKKVIDDFVLSTDAERTELRILKLVTTMSELKEFYMTKDLLTTSKIGISINKLRKSDIESVKNLATELLLKWKDLMAPPKRKIDDDSKEEAEMNEALEKKENESKTKMESENMKEDVNDHKKEKTSTPKSSNVVISSDIKDFFVGDSVRDKCLEMLVSALMIDQDEGQSPDELIINTAQSIEKSLFNEFNSTSPAYKSKFRSKYLNLKDKSNPTLRNALISGLVSADRFISMTAAEMASEERRRVDSKIYEQNLSNSQLAKDNSAETDQFKCGRCQQRKCKYYQMQTRSADEPMTTFVTCVNCGNRWRFC